MLLLLSSSSGKRNKFFVSLNTGTLAYNVRNRTTEWGAIIFYNVMLLRVRVGAMTRTDHLTTFEIGSMYGIAPQSLRFYEDQGLLSPLIEDGTRSYTAKDRIKLELIITGKRLGFSFIELKLLILQTIEQRALHDLVPLSSHQITKSVAEEEMIEEIWQSEKKIKQLQERVNKLQRLLAKRLPSS